MRRWLTRLVLALLLAAFGGVLFQYPWFQGLEYQGLDFWFFLRGPEKPSEDVILVALDEESYDALSIPMNKPWPRALHAQLLERMARAGAKKVVFDVIFGGPSDDPKVDAALADALGEMPTAIGVEVAPIAGEDLKEEVYLPYAPFRATVGEIAVVKKRTDGRFIRRFTPTFWDEDGKQSYRSLAQAGADLDPTDIAPDENDLIWFYGPSRTVKTYSYVDALDEEFFLDEEFAGKIIYVGLALQTDLGPAQKDAFQTPFRSRGDTFGVEIHATAALNMIHKDWITRWSLLEEAFVYSCSIFVIGLLLFALPPGYGLIFLMLTICGWGAASFYAFSVERVFIPGITLVGILAPAMYLVSTVFSYLAARQKQKQTEEAFSYYLSPEMAKQVSQNPDALNLGGETIIATALFTDIADFTKISESMQAEEVVQMLNEYFTEVMDAIFETQGTLIKFIGDAVFAIWGAPVQMDDHEIQTVRTALAIREKVRAFNDKQRFPELFTRMGVHTGPMVVGNLGSAKRFDYTAIGDSVNLTARLEGLNKYFGTDFLFSKVVEDKLLDEFVVCPLGRVAVKGKSEVVEVSTILDDSVPEEDAQTWKEGLILFHNYEWDNSEEAFKELLKKKSYFMKSAQLYLQQIPYRKITGTEDWQGEIVFEVK